MDRGEDRRREELVGRSFMYTSQKQVLVSVRDTNRSHTKGNIRRQALRKLAEYLRNERGYSENEIRKFMAESFVGKIVY